MIMVKSEKEGDVETNEENNSEGGEEIEGVETKRGGRRGDGEEEAKRNGIIEREWRVRCGTHRDGKESERETERKMERKVERCLEGAWEVREGEKYGEKRQRSGGR